MVGGFNLDAWEVSGSPDNLVTPDSDRLLGLNADALHGFSWTNAPELVTPGTVTAKRFVGDAGGLTNLPTSGGGVFVSDADGNVYQSGSDSHFSGSARNSAIFEGIGNKVFTDTGDSASNSVVVAGRNNEVYGTGLNGNASESIIGAGFDNLITKYWSMIGAGTMNSISDYESFIGAGSLSSCTDRGQFVGAGYNNDLGSVAAFSGVGAGRDNNVQGKHAWVPGGEDNHADGEASWAGGHYAHADHQGSFVWSDKTSSADLTTTANNQFHVGAAGGFWLSQTSSVAPAAVSGRVVFWTTNVGGVVHAFVTRDDGVSTQLTPHDVNGRKYKRHDRFEYVGVGVKEYPNGEHEVYTFPPASWGLAETNRIAIERQALAQWSNGVQERLAWVALPPSEQGDVPEPDVPGPTPTVDETVRPLPRSQLDGATYLVRTEADWTSEQQLVSWPQLQDHPETNDIPASGMAYCITSAVPSAAAEYYIVRPLTNGQFVTTLQSAHDSDTGDPISYSRNLSTGIETEINFREVEGRTAPDNILRQVRKYLKVTNRLAIASIRTDAQTNKAESAILRDAAVSNRASYAEQVIPLQPDTSDVLDLRRAFRRNRSQDFEQARLLRENFKGDLNLSAVVANLAREVQRLRRQLVIVVNEQEEEHDEE